eukprot:14714868-Alexandrium_andersonii.AAC.1
MGKPRYDRGSLLGCSFLLSHAHLPWANWSGHGAPASMACVRAQRASRATMGTSLVSDGRQPSGPGALGGALRNAARKSWGWNSGMTNWGHCAAHFLYFRRKSAARWA